MENKRFNQARKLSYTIWQLSREACKLDENDVKTIEKAKTKLWDLHEQLGEILTSATL